MTAEEFVLDDFYDTIWYDGVIPCSPIEDLVKYFDMFLDDCRSFGRYVPEDLTPELYYKVWTEEYERRIKDGTV